MCCSIVMCLYSIFGFIDREWSACSVHYTHSHCVWFSHLSLCVCVCACKFKSLRAWKKERKKNNRGNISRFLQWRLCIKRCMDEWQVATWACRRETRCFITNRCFLILVPESYWFGSCKNVKAFCWQNPQAQPPTVTGRCNAKIDLLYLQLCNFHCLSKS